MSERPPRTVAQSAMQHWIGGVLARCQRSLESVPHPFIENETMVGLRVGRRVLYIFQEEATVKEVKITDLVVDFVEEPEGYTPSRDEEDEDPRAGVSFHGPALEEPFVWTMVLTAPDAEVWEGTLFASLLEEGIPEGEGILELERSDADVRTLIERLILAMFGPSA